MADVDVQELYDLVMEMKRNQEMLQRRDALHSARSRDDDTRDELKKLVTRMDMLEKRVDAVEKVVKKK